MHPSTPPIQPAPATHPPRTFPFFEIRGAPRELGRQHGEACREQIHTYADTLLRVLAGEAALRSLTTAGGDTRGPSTADLYTRALYFLPHFEAYAPHLVEEIHGIAEGANVPFAAALLVNVRAEVAGITGANEPNIRTAPNGAVSPETSVPAFGGEAGCTAIAVGREAASGGALFLGQNQDQAPEMEALGVVLRVRPDDGSPLLMATFGGLIGYPGLNAHGVASFQNALSDGGWRLALPHYPLKRVLLEQRTLDGCLDAIGRAPLASAGNYVLGDGSGRLADVETTSSGFDVLPPEEGIIAHSNHFCSPRYRSAERLLESLPDSAPRLERMRALLHANHGRITLGTVKTALRDHAGGATAICRHEPDRPLKSIMSIIAEPDTGRLHVARGNPCESEYTAYDVE